MENTALVRLFDILNAAEKRRIKKKLESTERKGVDMLLLFNYLNKNIKKPDKLIKDEVYKAVFGEFKKVNDAKLTQLRYKLYRFIEDQIVIDQIMGANENKDHLIQKELILLDYYNYKVVPNSQRSVQGISKLVESKISDVEELIKTTNVKDIVYLLNLYRLGHHLYYNLSTEILGEGELYLAQLLKNLDVFYCLSKLRYSIEVRQRQKITNEKVLPIFLFDEIYEYSEKLNNNEFPLVSIYKLLADLSNKLDEAKIIELKNKLIENTDKLSNAELANSFFLLLNFMMQINREKRIDTVYLQYEVYKMILTKKLCILNGEIRPQFLINCAVNFVTTKKSYEIKKMLDEYSGHIPKLYKDKTIKLCNAYQLFGEGKFKDCIKLIYKQSFLPFNLQAKTLLLKSVYEVEFVIRHTSNVSFFDSLDNYRRFIRRKKKEMNQNFFRATVNFTGCLLQLTDSDNQAILKKNIDEFGELVERKWLLEKLEQKYRNKK